MEHRDTLEDRKLVRLFGLPRVQAGAAESVLTDTQALVVAVVALKQSRGSVTREYLKGLVWPEAEDIDETTARRGETDPEEARDLRLRTLLTELRKVLGAMLRTERQEVRLDFGAGEVDVLEFDRAIKRGRIDDIGAYEEAVRWYRGALLQGLNPRGYMTREGIERAELELLIADESGERERCYVEALATLASDAEERCDWRRAIEYRRMAFDLDGTNETFACKLFDLYHRTNEPQQVEAVHERLIRNLAEIDQRPNPLTTARAQGSAAAGAGYEPPNAEDRVTRRRVGRGIAPSPLTDLIGREGDLACAREMLLHPGVLTILGEPGIGKTRLVQELAARLQRRYQLEYFELGSLVEGQSVPKVLCQALGAEPESNPELALERYFHGREAILVLDNCEHALAACRALTLRLTRASTRLRVLATSRVPLGLPGERQYRLQPLGCPPLDGEKRAPLQEYPAARLFLARAAERQFELSEGDTDLVAQICGHLSGLPLAIELCAVWAQPLGPSKLRVERGASMARVLRDPRRSVEDPHRSLDAALLTSWELLSPSEQWAGRYLACFPAGMRVDWDETAWDILREEAGDQVPHGDDFLTLCYELLTRSMIQRRGDSGFTPRYLMLEPIREFCERQGEGESRQAITAAFRRCCWAMVLAEAESFKGPEEAVAIGALDRDWENIRAAACLSGWQEFARYHPAVEYFCGMTGRARELMELVARAGASLPAELDTLRDELAATRSALRQLVFSIPADQITPQAFRCSLVDEGEVRELIEWGIECCSEVRPEDELAEWFLIKGAVEYGLEVNDCGRSCFEAARRHIKSFEEPAYSELTLQLARAEERRGNLAAARDHYVYVQDTAWEGENRALLIQAQVGIARVCIQQELRLASTAGQDHQEWALECLFTAADTCRSVNEHAAGVYLAWIGHLLEKFGQVEASRECLQEALCRLTTLDDQIALDTAVPFLFGSLALAQGEVDAADRLVGCGEALFAAYEDLRLYPELLARLIAAKPRRAIPMTCKTAARCWGAFTRMLLKDASVPIQVAVLSAFEDGTG